MERELTQYEVQRMLKISRSTLWRWRRAGKFPPGKLSPSGGLRWSLEDVSKANGSDGE